MRKRRLVGASSAAIIGLSLYLVGLVPLAVATGHCVLTVEPESGPAGT